MIALGVSLAEHSAQFSAQWVPNTSPLIRHRKRRSLHFNFVFDTVPFSL